MIFIKRFINILESLINIKIPDWLVNYNHGPNHNLDEKLSKRVGISELDFEDFLKDVIKKCERENLLGDWIFISFKKRIKLVTNVDYINKKIYIVTILGDKEITKNQKNFKML